MKHQASKDIVVAACITDSEGNILVVQPAHKDGWIFPGGYVEVGESPSDACQRQVSSEIGVSVEKPPRLLSVDYRGQTGEYVMFIFDGGVCSEEMKDNIRLSPNLIGYRFVSADEAHTMLREHSARRLYPTLESRNKTGIAYMEDQNPL